MNTKMEAFQALLARMRDEFVGELPERCDRLDTLIMALEKSPGDRDVFDELYRGVHSLKGSGGTHGLSVITTLCHQLENLITETDAQNGFGTSFATRALAYVDLVRQVETLAHQESANYSAIETGLETLRQAGLHSRKTGLIAESSSLMAGLYQKALESLPLQLTLENNGMTALARLLHEPFDFVIVGRELNELNGIALMAAVRAAEACNQNIPAILVSSKKTGAPAYANFNSTISRDQKLAENLLGAVRQLLPA